MKKRDLDHISGGADINISSVEGENVMAEDSSTTDIDENIYKKFDNHSVYISHKSSFF